jgi:D-sedoheptulose 7-phosphate isomerase
VVVGISTSGSSANVRAGLDAAKKIGALTVLFTGRAGGEAARAADQVDLILAAPSDVTARVQECHLLAGHILCDLVEEAFATEG